MGKGPLAFKSAVSLKGQRRGKEVVPSPHPLDKASLAKEGGYQHSCDPPRPESLHGAVSDGMKILLQLLGRRLRMLLAASHFREATIKLSRKTWGTHAADNKP